jgi:hypothetical protein
MRKRDNIVAALKYTSQLYFVVALRMLRVLKMNEGSWRKDSYLYLLTRIVDDFLNVKG